MKQLLNGAIPVYNHAMDQPHVISPSYTAARVGAAQAVLAGSGWLHITGRNREELILRRKTFIPLMVFELEMATNFSKI
jgi:hypothetical protein